MMTPEVHSDHAVTLSWGEDHNVPEPMASSSRSLDAATSLGVARPPPASRRFHTVEMQDEEHLHLRDTSEQATRGDLAACWWKAQGWILAFGIGVCSSLSGSLIEFLVHRLATLRFGICDGALLTPSRACPLGQWRYWGDSAAGFVINIGMGTFMAFISACIVYRWAPAAAGSGIPEVKTILNGFVMPDVVALRTLLVKVPGLALSVAAGMSLGKEGPLVHVAVCWAQQWSMLFGQFQNEGKRRELFSAAAAAGVSTAFGAPLGGVLFSLEEVSSFFPSQTLLRCFTAAVVAAIVLSVINSSNTKGLTLFSVEYNTACHPVEYIAFALLGVAGGIVGIIFNSVNVRWSRIRMNPKFRKRVHPVLEVTCIALVTLLTSWPMPVTRQLSSESIHAMFESCGPGSTHELRGHLGFCTEGDHYAPLSRELLVSLAMGALVRLLQTILTFGTACPAGLFVPSLFTGACLGRLVGVVAHWANADHRFFPRDVEPGVYAMVGAAAVLGGVCRVTISLVAIMLELTGGMTYIVPFMITVLTAKIVGDAANEGIYDLYIVLRGYPFLQEDLEVTYTERCCDVMDTELTVLDLNTCRSIENLRSLLDRYGFSGFPVVKGDHFLGYAKRGRLKDLVIKHESAAQPALLGMSDILDITDCTVMRMVPDAPLTQAHKVFYQLGRKFIFLVGSKGHNEQEQLQGMLSKKNFIKYRNSGKVGHNVDHPSSTVPTTPRGMLRSGRAVLSRVFGRSRHRSDGNPNELEEALRAGPRASLAGDDDDTEHSRSPSPTASM
eukprot:TRINITY_DN24806_c0_g1_i1.p1 TRINITY_DN24806_c0_g1~~TRINITY_DN24806_c0_g1_i1.p1  ORF type:complete len:781 (+),score=93.02 TRINITY_DN24806_c0_g1_i1:69-2411(+)